MSHCLKKVDIEPGRPVSGGHSGHGLPLGYGAETVKDLSGDQGFQSSGGSSAVLQDPAWRLARIGLEAGQLSRWLVDGLADAGLPVVCIETRHAKALVSNPADHEAAGASGALSPYRARRFIRSWIVGGSFLGRDPCAPGPAALPHAAAGLLPMAGANHDLRLHQQRAGRLTLLRRYGYYGHPGYYGGYPDYDRHHRRSGVTIYFDF